MSVFDVERRRRILVGASKVVIVGGGVSGLVCARTLHRSGVPFQLFESGDQVGGRVRTDLLNEFKLDRGFQVLLDSYPECQDQLDFEALELRSFQPGALVRYRGKFVELTDPWRKPSAALKTLFAPVATFLDKVKLARLRNDVRGRNSSEDRTTEQYLQDRGLSSRVIESFFRPFFGGVFLERELSTSSGKFKFLFDKFGTGNATLPKEGMGQITRQLMESLPPESLALSSPVKAVFSNRVVLDSDDVIDAGAVVVATDGFTASRLLGDPVPPKSHSVYCLYFAASKRSDRRPILVLNGESGGPINHLCWLTAVNQHYAPARQDLLSVTVLNHDAGPPDTLLRRCMDQLQAWYGNEVADLSHLKTYEIRDALPVQDSQFRPGTIPVRHASGVYRCGDYIEFASLNGAMLSGRRCAEAVLESLETSALL